MKLILLLSCLILSACAQHQPISHWASTPPANVFVADEVEINWVRGPVPAGVCDAYKSDAMGKVSGCAVFDGRTCTIYAPEPRSSNDYERISNLGHEAMHCFYGQFHS